MSSFIFSGGGRSPGQLRLGGDDLLRDLEIARRAAGPRGAPVISTACIQRLRSAFAPSSMNFWTTMRSDSRCTGCMYFTSSVRRRVDCLRHLAGDRRSRA